MAIGTRLFAKTRKPEFSGQMRTPAHTGQLIYTFYHPDYTVGPGVPPDHASKDARGLLPPVGNCTLPRRWLFNCYQALYSC